MNTREIRKIVMDEMGNYSQFYGAMCYHAGADNTRELPKDLLIDESVRIIVNKIKDLYAAEKLKQRKLLG